MKELADRLTREGYRTPRSQKGYTSTSVRKLLSRRGLTGGKIGRGNNSHRTKRAGDRTWPTSWRPRRRGFASGPWAGRFVHDESSREAHGSCGPMREERRRLRELVSKPGRKNTIDNS